MGHVLRLDGETSTLVIDARGPGIPRECYWGGALPLASDLAALADSQARPWYPSGPDHDVPTSLLPETGLGDFGHPGLSGVRDRRHWATAFRLVEVERLDDALTFRLEEPIAGLSLDIEITVDAATDVQSRRCRLRNVGDTPYRLDWCAAGVFRLPPFAVEALTFEGRWTREFQERRVDLGVGGFVRDNRRGRTSHDAFPGLIAGPAGFSEQSGRVFGFHLAWSGNHRLVAEVLPNGDRRIVVGELPMPGEIVLAPGETYETPWVHTATAPDGLNGLSHRFHRFVRERVLRWPHGAMTPRPVVFNSWEAVYFHHDLERLRSLADAAAAIGAERFVLDDGWFGARDDDTTSLGDWMEHPGKWPDGLGPLIDHVRSLGMEFGLWVEPEMVNPESALYRAHPDWALNVDPLPRPTVRSQLVLDLSRAEVADHVFSMLDGLLQRYPIAYLKWDMNRDVATAGSDGVPAYGAQARALWALLDRLRSLHPDVEIESCASGGARADYGMLERTHRIWTSDSNDPLQRQTIQQGFSRFFPACVMGAHLGPSPAHTSGRRCSVAFRGLTALFGHFGLELDLLALDAAERRDVAAIVALYKRFRELLHEGRQWRLDHLEPGRIGYGVAADDGAEALFCLVQMASPPFAIAPPVLLPGLNDRDDYRVAIMAPEPTGAYGDTDLDVTLPGAVLTRVGLQLPTQMPETALLLHVSRRSSLS